MADYKGSTDGHNGLQPIDVRVATFLAEIQADSQGTSRSTSNQVQILADHHQHCPEWGSKDQTAISIEDSRGRRKKTGNSSGKSSGTRRHRYRDERQKLSNSLAQKRYRERKKQAFDELKNLVDCLTIEVQQLRYVKTENQSLTLALEDCKRMTQLRENTTVIQKEKSAGSELEAITEVLVCSSPPSMTTSTQAAQLPPMMTTPMTSGPVPQQLLLDLGNVDAVGVMKHICTRTSNSQLDSCASLAARVEFLEKEWNDRMSAVEQFLKIQRTCGAMTLGASPNDLQSVMKESMAKLFSLHSELASAKLLHLSEEVQANNNRITEAFADFIDDAKSK